MRFITGGIVIGAIVWLGVFMTQYFKDKEQLAEMRHLNAVQERSMAVYQRQAELADAVLQFRERQRGMHETVRQRAVHDIYQAQGGVRNEGMAWNFDEPLPRDIVVPLRMQYEAITACGAGYQSQATQSARAGTACSTAAGGNERAKSGLVDQ